jgi:hypothetical protein
MLLADQGIHFAAPTSRQRNSVEGMPRSPSHRPTFRRLLDNGLHIELCFYILIVRLRSKTQLKRLLMCSRGRDTPVVPLQGISMKEKFTLIRIRGGVPEAAITLTVPNVISHA